MPVTTKDMLLFLFSSVLVSSETNRKQRVQLKSKEDEGFEVAGTADAVEGQFTVDTNTQLLKHRWVLSYERKSRASNTRLKKADYLKEVKKAGSFQTISSFWACWSQVQEICKISSGEEANYHLFRDNIQPIWEDPKNIKGGKWVVVLPENTPHSEIMRNWMSLMLTLLLEELGFETEINGAVLSVRSWGSMFSIWNRNSKDKDLINAVGTKLKELFGVEYVKYQRHQVNMQRNNDRVKQTKRYASNSSSDDSVTSSDASSSSEGEQDKQIRPKRRSAVSDTRSILPEVTSNTKPQEQVLQPSDLAPAEPNHQPALELELTKEPESNDNKVEKEPEVIPMPMDLPIVEHLDEPAPEEGAETPDASKNRRRRRKLNAQKKSTVVHQEIYQPPTEQVKSQPTVAPKHAVTQEALSISKLGMGLLLMGVASAISWAIYL